MKKLEYVVQFAWQQIYFLRFLQEKVLCQDARIL